MFRGLKGRRVIITTVDGGGFEGRVVTAAAEYIALSDFTRYEPGGPAEGTRAAGVARVPRAFVAFVQDGAA